MSLDHRAEVAGRVDLGHDGDVQVLGQVQDPTQLGGREVLLGDDLRVRGALQPEALVVREVQAELVHLEVGHLTHPGLDPARREVLARDVQLESALGPAGPVADHTVGQQPGGPHRLQHRPGSVEDPGLVGTGDHGAAVADREPVRLRAAGLAPLQFELHVTVPGGTGRVAHPEFSGEPPGLVGERPVADHAGVLLGLPAGALAGLVGADGRDGARRGGRHGRAGGRSAPALVRLRFTAVRAARHENGDHSGGGPQGEQLFRHSCRLRHRKWLSRTG